jgi:hypothetical protein
MIGLSLSFGVRDIIAGVVHLEDVEKIIASTKIESPDHLDQVIASYREAYWWKNPELGELVARELWDRGKIHQPHLHGGPFPVVHGGIWVESEDQIEWRPNLWA